MRKAIGAGLQAINWNLQGDEDMLKWRLTSTDWSKIKTDLVVALIGEKEGLCKKSPPTLARALKEYEGKLKDKTISTEWFDAAGGPGGAGLYLDTLQNAKGLGKGEGLKTLIARALEFAEKRGLKRLAILADSAAGAATVPDIVEGLILADYRFDRYKTAKTPTPKTDVSVIVSDGALSTLRAATRSRARTAEAVNLARDLVNEPAHAVTPETLATHARALGRKPGFKVTVYDEKQLKTKGYEGLRTVGAGSQYPPRLITIEYTPKGKITTDARLCLVGKGMTFDSGGVCLKTAPAMWTMKGDMAGAGAVLATMTALDDLRPPVPVSAVIATACNAIDAKAHFPGTIFKARNGKTVHVDNTDAEGRLILTDALWRAGELKPTHVVDLATLTGSIVMALGPALSGLFSNDSQLATALKAAADASGDAIWEMPLVEEYRKALDWEIADLNNIHNSGSRYGGSITAALFLREFVPDGVAWAHLDIAGPFMTPSPTSAWKYYRPGATGVGVRLLCEWIDGFNR